MQNSQCIGCKTIFQEGQAIKVDFNSVEFKDHQIPIKEDSIKWNLLRTIISFLNYQGGTLCIGISPQSQVVKGLFLERKERDSFKLTLKQLMEKVYPKIDLNNKQQVEVHYMPVFKGNSFEGKYVVKIIVQQGDPSQVYCISQRIKFQDENGSKTDEIQVHYAYERQKNGITRQFKGFDLMNLIYEKATNNNKLTAFHQGCNPQPPYHQLQIRTIRFTNLNSIQYKMLQISYLDSFEKMDIEYIPTYHTETSLADIVIEDQEDFETVKEYVIQNIKYLNQMFGDTSDPTHLVVKGEHHHYFHLHNDYGQRGAKKEAKKEQGMKEVEVKMPTPKFPYQERKAKRQEANKARETIPKSKPALNPIPKEAEYVILFTHIEPQSIDTLQKYLRNSVFRAYQKTFIRYFNSIQLHLTSEKQRNNYLNQLSHKGSQLAGFGFKQEIRYGLCENILKICNVDLSKNKEMRTDLKAMMGPDVLEMKNQKNALLCQMVSREATCLWLDRLLNERGFKKAYSLKGPQKITPKLKIYISVSNSLKH